MTYILIICFFVVIFFVLFLVRASKGRIYHIEELKAPIDNLLKRGYDGGLLTITVKGAKDFIRLEKKIYNKDDYEINLLFQDLEWNRDYFPKLVKFCNTNKVKYTCNKDEDFTDNLIVGFGKDSHKAFWMVKNILEKIFTTKGEYYVLLENANRWDVLVDSPDASEHDISFKEDLTHVVNTLKNQPTPTTKEDDKKPNIKDGH